MGKKVFANGMEVAHKAGMNKVIAAFPDVCLSPPSPPAGPIPLPYPDTSTAADLKEGSTTVTIGGQPAGLKDQSYYATSPLGNEAATKTFGGGVVTHTITGKTFFAASSMNVKFEGTNVVRHLDVTTSNHLEQPGSTPIIPSAESQNVVKADDADKPKCPCCGGDAHSNQVDEKGNLRPKIKEADYYKGQAEPFMKRRDEMQSLLDSGNTPPWATEIGTSKNPLYDGLLKKDIIINKGNDLAKAATDLDGLRGAHKDCPNVHEPPDTGCGTHFAPGGNTAPARAEADKARFGFLRRYRGANPGSGVTMSAQVNHKTPIDAGGCPISDQNQVPDPVLTGPCKQIEDLQTKLQNAQTL